MCNDKNGKEKEKSAEKFGPARDAVILHERTHIRRGDPLTKPLFYAVACLHWFNPLAWLAFREFERDMEAACDEAAVRGQSSASCICCITAAWGPGPCWSAPWSLLPA